MSVTELITQLITAWAVLIELDSSTQLRHIVVPRNVWNVYDATLTGRERTNNVCEGWNNAFATMVGHHHPSLWCLIGALQQDQAMVATALLQDARGQPSAKRCKRSVVQQQQRLHKLYYERRDGTRSVNGHVPSDILSDSSDCLLINIYRPSYVTVLMKFHFTLFELCNCSCNCNTLN